MLRRLGTVNPLLSHVGATLLVVTGALLVFMAATELVKARGTA